MNPNGYKDKNPMLDFLVNQTMDYIAQMAEESIINQHGNAQIGVTNPSKTSDQFEFVFIALELFQCTLTSQFIEFSQIMFDNMIKIQSRIQKIIAKKENPLTQNFINKNEVQQTDLNSDFYNLEQLQDL